MCGLGKTGQLSTENVSLQSEVKSQRELIEQLELDVSSLQNLSSLNRGEAEVFMISQSIYSLASGGSFHTGFSVSVNDFFPFVLIDIYFHRVIVVVDWDVS